jgi:hypothetical protein
MRLIMNFNRASFEQFDWEQYNRIELDEGYDNTIRMVPVAVENESDVGYAFSPSNSTDENSGVYRYKVRVPEDDSILLGLEGSYRYEVDKPVGSDEFILTPHSIIYPGYPERHDLPMVSVSFTETEDGAGNNERPFTKTARRVVTQVPVGNDSSLVMNTLVGGMVPVYMGKNKKTGAIRSPESFVNPKTLRDLFGDLPPEAVHIRPWESGADENEKLSLLTDLNNLWFLHPYLNKLFNQGDFSVSTKDGHLAFAPDSEAESLFRVSPKVSFFSFKITELSSEMMEYFEWHRENVLRS